MKSAREVAEGMVPAPVDDGDWCSELRDGEACVPMQPYEDQAAAEMIVRDARGIIERLVARERAPLEAVLRDVETWLTAEQFVERRHGRSGPDVDELLAKVEAALAGKEAPCG